MPINENESTKKVKLNLSGLSNSEKELAKQEAGRILLEEIETYLDASISPVKDGAYRANKVDGTRSDLYDVGDMRSQLEFRSLDSDHIEVGIFKSAPSIDRAKAFGHNSGFKGHKNERKLKKYKREFIPAPNKTFRGDIMERVNESIDEFRGIANEREELIQEIISDNTGDILSILGLDLGIGE